MFDCGTTPPVDFDTNVLLGRLSEDSRERRIEDAHRRLWAIEEVEKGVGECLSRQQAEDSVGWAHRSTLRRWRKGFDEKGFSALIDKRTGGTSAMPEAVRMAICTLRQADPNVSVEDIAEFILKYHEYVISESTIKRELKAAGLGRRVGRPKRGPGAKPGRRLELGGMKLLEAALVETGYLDALSEAVVAHLAELIESEAGVDQKPADSCGRDDQGRFLSKYNERYRKSSDDRVGPGFASVELKRSAWDVRSSHLAKASLSTVQRKMKSLLVSPQLGTGRWDGIRSRRGELLEELCGFAYMPATLELFARELKYAGVANTLWEVHAREWLRLTSQWGPPRNAAVIYVDGSTKGVWTKHYAQSTMVKAVGRVMPGLEQVAFHTGYGVPLWIATHSGRAPLTKVVPGYLTGLDKMLGESSVGRIVVIDAEGHSVRFLKELESPPSRRGWMTRLREDWIDESKIFNRTNYQPYRPGERVRMGELDLDIPGEDEKFRIRVVEVERRRDGPVMYLGVSVLLEPRDWKPKELADLYLERWPKQEANFRAVNQATRIKQVHGYGKRLVTNVSVVTKLDKLSNQLRQLPEQLERQRSELSNREQQLSEETKGLNKLRRRQETVIRTAQRSLEAKTERGQEKLEQLREECEELDTAIAEKQSKADSLQKRIEAIGKKTEKTKELIATAHARKEELESHREILAHDVELDSIFSVMKVGLTLLVVYALKKYLGNPRMDVTTFLDRVATIPGRLTLTPQYEIVMLEYNRRDPEIMGFLRSCCDKLNEAGLLLESGRRLLLKIEEAPPPARDPPPGSRFGSGDRFKRS